MPAFSHSNLLGKTENGQTDENRSGISFALGMKNALARVLMPSGDEEPRQGARQ